MRYLLAILFLFGSVIFALPSEKERALMDLSLNSLGTRHFSPLAIDDVFSERVYGEFLDSLDPRKLFFTETDISILSEFRDDVDNDLNEGDSRFFDAAITLYEARVLEVKAFYKSILKEDFDYSLDESFQSDPKKRDYVTDEGELRVFWRSYIKYLLMLAVFDDRGNGEENTEKVDGFTFSPKVLKKAQKKVKTNLSRRFDRLLKDVRESGFHRFINSIASSFDPHTSYFPPEDKEDFDISLSGRLEGIGAVLQEDDGYIKVVRIVPGGPAWQQGDLDAEDLILSVQNKRSESIDLSDVAVREAVKNIRGPKGSEVRLTVKKPDGQITTISIIRDVVVVEESYAKSAVISDSRSGKAYGYIYLPSFYRDFTDNRARNATDDVGDILASMNARNVAGVVLDLRHNGGGSLLDAVGVTGKFIKTGPVVQVQHPSNQTEIRYDKDARVAYDGPLVVLINTYSASASEIVAAALQDYGRAVLIGTAHSFGKGTVQTFVDYDSRILPKYGYLKPLGSLKLTVQKFYRINGGSTQFKGVVPDVILPSTSDYLDIGERTLTYPMAWTQIPSVSYQKWPANWRLDEIRSASQARLDALPATGKIREYTKKLSGYQDAETPLNIAQAWERRHELEAYGDSFEEEFKVADYLNVERIYPIGNGAVFNEERAKKDAADFEKSIRKDFVVDEAVLVLEDMQ